MKPKKTICYIHWVLSLWIALFFLAYTTLYYTPPIKEGTKETFNKYNPAEEVHSNESKFKEFFKVKAPSQDDKKIFKKWNRLIQPIIQQMQTSPKVTYKKQLRNNFSFIPLNNAKVTTVNNVCIMEYNRINKTKIVPRKCQEQTYTLVVYNSGMNANKRLHGFNVTYKTAPVPSGYKSLNQTAFFHGYDKFFWPDNFYHFTKQFYFPLHYLISETRSLYKKEKSAVFFVKPFYPCINAPFMDIFFPYLNIDNGADHAYYPGYHRGGICFENAVFSNDLHLEHAENAILHSRKKLGAKIESCTEKNKIVLLRRKKNRQIVNALNLSNVAVQNGFNNFSIFYMEDLSIEKQMQTILCTRVIIGVQGAGLQWAYFMRPLSVVVEIAWPMFGWNFFYSKLSTQEGVIKKLNFISLETKDVVNKTECLNTHLVKHRPKIKLEREQYSLTTDELFKALKSTYPGKMCNVKVDEKLFLDAVKKAVEMVGN